MFMELIGKRSRAPQQKKAKPAGKDARATAQMEEAMKDLNNDVPKFVTRARASYLLGIPQEDLRRISEESGLGHLERAGNEEVMYFTYEELRRICQLASPLLASL
jgi:hypothetical protein